jgi:hypothetical protein
MLTISSQHTQACFEAWMNCENLLVKMASLNIHISKKVHKVIDECALICMGTFHALKSCSENTSRFALLCVGICEECAEICEAQVEQDFETCAKACRVCSNTISSLVKLAS